MPIESLEQRRLLSHVLSSGVLTITGTSSADRIGIAPSGTALHLDDNGILTDFAAGTVTSIAVGAGGGDDRVSVDAAITLPSTIVGAGGNDVLVGGSGNDSLSGGAGNDLLLGGAGDDVISGDDDNDTIDGGAGADVMFGGKGNDTADYSSRTEPLKITIDDAIGDGAAGENDNVGLLVEAVLGGIGNDSIVGSSANNALFGRNGKDTLRGGGGNDALFGAAHSDLLVGGPGNDYIESGTGTNALQGEAGDDKLVGGADKDALIGGSGNDVLDGGLGDDFLDGQGGSDTIDYTLRKVAIETGLAVGFNDPNDPDAPTPGGLQVYGGGGQDGESDSYSFAETILTGSADDNIRVDHYMFIADWPFLGNFLIDAGPGDDTFQTDYGASEGTLTHDKLALTLQGGAGNDHFGEQYTQAVMIGGPGDDSFAPTSSSFFFPVVFNFGARAIGGAGHDTINNSSSDVGSFVLGPEIEACDVSSEFVNALTITGNELDNIIIGGQLNDTITGAGGNDFINGGTGTDSLLGGEGDDSFINADGGEADTVDGGEGFDIAQGETVDLLSNIEFVYDQPVVAAEAQLAHPQATAASPPVGGLLDGSVLRIGGQADAQGAPVADNVLVLLDSINRKIVVTQNGVTSIYTRGSISSISIDTGGGNDVIALQRSTGARAVRVPAIISGGAGNDRIAGGFADDTISGGSGNDAIDGGEGRDSLLGGIGNDKLFGSGGDDILDGGANSTSPAGADYYSGGAGNDVVDYVLRSDNLIIDLADGTLANDGAAGEADNVQPDVEYAFTGRGNDTIIGSPSANFISGGAGKNILQGGAGNDILVATAGDDALIGGAGVNFYLMQDRRKDDFDVALDASGKPLGVGVSGDANLDLSTISKRVLK